MKILVLGSKGQIGRCIKDQFNNKNHNIIYVSREQIDIGSLKATKNKILNINPKIIINASAYTAVDKAEEDVENATLINHSAVANIATICKELNCWLIHMSTDYVFDGYSNNPYKENDKTNPQTVYGVTKLKGEIAIQSSKCKHIIIRTSWVFSEHGNNFLKTMLQLSTDHSQLNIVDDQIGRPTYAQDIASAIVTIVDSIKSKKVLSSLYHFSGNYSCSWAEFSQVIFDEAFRLDVIKSKPNIVGIPSYEYPTKAKRPAKSELNSNKIGTIFSIHPSNCILGIQSALMAIKKRNIL